MTEQDDAPRDANGDRLPVDEGKRSGGGTLADIFAATSANMVRQQEAHERRATETAAHRVGCKAEECRICERSRCYQCQTVKQGLEGLCGACKDREAFERAKARVFASIPKRFRWAIDRNLETLSATPPSFALTGVTGAGKTSLAVALFATWFAKHRDEGARFVPAIELGLARARHPLGHDDPPAVVAACQAPLLILDDLGAEAPMHADVVRQVLHQRHNDDLPTWITTGLTQADLARRFDGGLARRLFEEAKQVALGLP